MRVLGAWFWRASSRDRMLLAASSCKPTACGGGGGLGFRRVLLFCCAVPSGHTGAGCSDKTGWQVVCRNGLRLIWLQGTR